MYSQLQKCIAEAVGTALLLATIIGSGIMGETLSENNVAIALLGNTIPTGTILIVLITLFGPISGAHFNPVVSFVFWIRKEIEMRMLYLFIIAQIIGGIVGVLIAHAMFDLEIIQVSTKVRNGPSQWFSEIIATFGLIIVILGTIKTRPSFVPIAVGLYITAAYWFTASTSFANPAVTIARSLSDTFAGITPVNILFFIIAQIIGALIGAYYYKWQFEPSE